MRKIGELRDERQARVFSDALYARGFDNDVEAEDGSGFVIWVHDDDQLPRARELLQKFHASPDAVEWQSAASSAARKRKQEQADDERRAGQVITRERLEYERNYTGSAWVPML